MYVCLFLICRIWTHDLWNRISSRLNAREQTDWAIEDQAKHLNTIAHSYDQRTFSQLDTFGLGLMLPYILLIYAYINLGIQTYTQLLQNIDGMRYSDCRENLESSWQKCFRVTDEWVMVFCGAVNSETQQYPYPEPIYTGWSSVHWNATEMPLVDPVYNGIPLDDPVNTCRTHWNTTGKTLFKLPHTGVQLEKPWLLQPTLEHHWRDCKSPHTPRYT